MSGLHLSHKLPWNDLVECLQVYKDPGIELPVGDCGHIHLDRKKTECQLKLREYLDSEVCREPHCSTTGSKLFRKNEKLEEFSLFSQNRFPRNTVVDTVTDKSQHFVNCLAQAIREFSMTERSKVVNRQFSDKDSSSRIEAIISQLKTDNRWVKPGEYDYYYRSCNCFLITMLIEAGDATTLLSLSNEEIQAVLSCLHGGQAVGNNIQFLTFHLLQVYLTTNLIIRAGLENSPDKWGYMKPGSYSRRNLMHDCDGQTFLYAGRRFLTDETYMKDWDGMKQLSKECFRFLYFLDMLRMEVSERGSELEFERLKKDLQHAVISVNQQR